MGVATRDFIPDDSEMTPVERSRNQRGKMIRTGANHQDFIPDPEFPTAPRPVLSAVEKADRAMEYANQRALQGERTDWLTAIERLKNWNAPQAIDAMANMPFRLMEMYCVVERAYGARQDILRVFGEPDANLTKKFAEIQAAIAEENRPVEPAVEADEPFKGSGDNVSDVEPPEGGYMEAETSEPSAPAEDSTVEPEATAEGSILGTADLGDAAPAEEVTPAQTYDCIDCDFQAKSLGGLKAHERAKHGIGDAEEVPTEPQAGE